jgi:hypothetical protein
LTPEIAEAISVRPPARSSILVVAVAFCLISPPWLETVVQGRELEQSVTADSSREAQLCRFRC